MTLWLLIDLAVLLCVMLLTGIIIPQILLIAFRKNLFDTPNPRKIHTSAVPRLGGIAFFPSIMFAILLLYGFGTIWPDHAVRDLLYKNMRCVCFSGAGAILLYLTGMADDLVGVRYKAKFIMQIISAALVIVGGIIFNDLHGFLGLYNLPLIVSIILTILLMVFIINAINLIDGIDGLASALSAIACAFYAFVFYVVGMYVFSALAAATFGALVPFFLYNVFGNPVKHKKIFMGDTGALTIGLFLGLMCIRVCSIESVPNGANTAVIGFAPLLIPCFDVVRVYLHRIKSGKNPFLPDKTHIHHKLLALGLGQRIAMMTIICCSVFLTMANYWLAKYIDITILFAIDVLLWIALNAILTRLIRKREKSISQRLYE